MKSKNKAVFLDRDGVINVDKGYVHTIKEFEFCEKAIEGIRLLTTRGFKLIVVSNQSGIGRGYYSEDEVVKLHQFLNEELQKRNTSIDAFYYCPHHPKAAMEKYKVNCRGRKPGTLLLEKAIEEFNLDVKASFLVGDKASDIQAGKKVGCRTILVKTGHGKQHIGKCNYSFMAKNLYEAAKLILCASENKGSNYDYKEPSPLRKNVK